MEETLMDCLVRVREDLNQLKRVRNYLDTKKNTEESCCITWRTIEAFNSILSVCSSQDTPETDALDTLLDSFYYLAKNNADDRVWEDFGFELGIICVKVLSAIERTETFEILFCKLLSVIGIICCHNAKVWKATARQILNVLINKKVSFFYLEAILKVYIAALKNINSSALDDFSNQNLHLLKTLSLLVEQIGDFEIQSNVIQLIFLHFSKDSRKLFDFLSMDVKKIFQNYTFTNFECDCRMYLNEINNGRGVDKKVYSIRCHVLYFGGHFVEPPNDRDFFWVDANKDSERLTIKCRDVESNDDRIIYVNFSDILALEFKDDKSGGNRCLTIDTKSLVGFSGNDKHGDICLVVENVKEVLEFVSFLRETIGERKRQKFGGKESKTVDYLLINRSSPIKDVQDNAVTSSEILGIDQILPNVLTLFDGKSTVPVKCLRSTTTERKTPSQTFQESKAVYETQKISSKWFAESLDKHIGLGSPEQRHPFEDSVETVEFFTKTSSGGGHKLFQISPHIYSFGEEDEPNTQLQLDENKENNQPGELVKPNIRTYSRKTKNDKPTKLLNFTNNLKMKLTNTQSEDYFQLDSNVLKKKKPSLPKLKRPIKENANEEKVKKGTNENKPNIFNETKTINESRQKEFKSNKLEWPMSEEQINFKCDNGQMREELHQIECDKEWTQVETKVKLRKKQGGRKHENLEETSGWERQAKGDPVQNERKGKSIQRTKKISNVKEEKKQQAEAKPSLLDPKGYAYKRWCKPTTSERSNFWLKKLNTLQKSKTDSDSVFEFTEDSDSIQYKNKQNKRMVYSKKKYVTKTKPITLRQVKKILKTSSPAKEKPNKTPQDNEQPDDSGRPAVESPRKPSFQSFIRKCFQEIPQTDHTQKCSSRKWTEEAEIENSELEFQEDEEFPRRTTKRERSNEDSSAAKRCGKRKWKTSLPKNLLSSLRRRLRKTEVKNKQCTDEIIQTVTEAINQVFNHVQRKDGEQAASYLKAAETSSTSFATEIDELRLRTNRIQRAIFYFKAGCSVSDFCESLDAHISRVRNALKKLRERKTASKTVDAIADRLTELIKSEVERSIRNEWASKQKKLFNCASVFGTDFREWP